MTDPALHLVVYTEASFTGGAEISCGHLLSALDPSIRVTVVGARPEVVEWLAARRPETDTVIIPQITGKRDLAGMRAHRRLIASLRPTVFQANLTHLFSCEYALAMAISVPGVATIAVEHAPFDTPVSWARRRLKRWVARRLSAHIAVGEQSAQTLEETVGLPRHSVHAIHNGVPAFDGAPVARITPGPVIGVMARLEPRKGLDVLLHAMTRNPAGTLVIVGDGPGEAELRALTDRLDLDDRVVFAGWTEDPGAWLPSIDLYVLPSRNESLPLSICEAMLAGLAVVATDVGSVSEIVIDGETGLLVPVDDVDALGEAIARLLGDEPTRRAMGRRGRERVERDFSVAGMVRSYEALYETILHARAGDAAS